MYRLPFNREDCYAIGNYVNHGETPNPPVSGYIRDDKYCVTGDNDNNKPTYWRGAYRHDGTDFMLPEGSAIFAPCDCVVNEVDTSNAAGNTLEVKTLGLPGYMLYFRFLHLNKIVVQKFDTISAGDIIAFSGATGSMCGVAHLHVSIGTSSGNGNIDPLTDKRFKHWFQNLPFVPRVNHKAPHFKAFTINSPQLLINNKSAAISWNGEEVEYIFQTNKPIHRLLNVSKFYDKKFEDVENYDLITELGSAGALNGDKYHCVVVQDANIGVYYYQAQVATGEWTSPARIVLKDRIVL